jgi:hypothetical protein
MEGNVMFEVNKNSWHYRWLSYLFLLDNRKDYVDWLDGKRKGHGWLTDDFFADQGYPPREFCGYWRAVILWPALKLLLSLSMIAVSVFFLSFATFSGTLVFGIVFVAVILALLGIIGVLYLIDHMKSDKTKNAVFNSFFGEIYKTQKSKICPMIKYTKEGSDNG